MKLLLAFCRQPGGNVLRAGDIRLVLTTCNKSDFVTRYANNLFQICQTTEDKQCERILTSASWAGLLQLTTCTYPKRICFKNLNISAEQDQILTSI